MTIPQDIIDAKLDDEDIKNLSSRMNSMYGINNKDQHEIPETSLETHTGVDEKTWKTYKTDSSEYRNMLIYAYNYEAFNKATPELVQTVKNNPVAFATLFSIANEVSDDSHFTEFNKDFGSDQASAEVRTLLDMATDEDKKILKEAEKKQSQSQGQGQLSDQQLINEIGLGDNIIDQEQFKLPDMGDYYLGNVDQVFLEQLDEKIRNKKDAEVAAHYAQSAPETELGYNKKKGTYFLKCIGEINNVDYVYGHADGNHICIDINTMSAGDEDTTAALDKINKQYDESLAEYPLLKNYNTDHKWIDLQILGINAPRRPRWCHTVNVDYDTIGTETTLRTMTLAEAEATDNVVMDKSEYYSSDGLKAVKGDTLSATFLYILGSWRQLRNIKQINSQNGKTCYSFDWLLEAGDSGIETAGEISYDLAESATEATKKLKSILDSAGNVIYVKIDETGLSESSNKFPLESSGIWSSVVNQAQLQALSKGALDNGGNCNGYSTVAEYRSCRFLGEVYIKDPSHSSEEVYINVAKLMANDDPPLGVTFSTDYEGDHKSAFDMKTYDIHSRVYADAFFELADQYDDRPQIQQELFGVDWANLQENNVILGDVCFWVPPTNIRMQTYTQSERLDIMRAKGSATKTSPNQHRIIAMDIYFNEDRGINGTAYMTQLPNGQTVAYFMNGLRALMSMFRFTPYLPITNKFINKTLGIDAVYLNSLHLQQVSGYPKLIQATITMTEFSWTVFMPDIMQMALVNTDSSLTIQDRIDNDATVAYWERSEEQKKAEKEAIDAAKEALKKQHIQNLINGVEDNYDEELEKLMQSEQKTLIKDTFKNWFARTFNWRTFRYYYQRPLIRGNILSYTDLSFNSEPYIQATCGALTSFVPMRFEDPGIKFYMADEIYLKQVQQQRFEMLRGNTIINFNEEQLNLMQAYADISNKLQEHLQSEEFISAVREMNETTQKLLTGPELRGVYAKGACPFFTDASDVLENAYSYFFDYNKGGISNVFGYNEEKTIPTNINKVLSGIDAALEPLRVQYSDYFEQDCDYISYLNGKEGIAAFGLGIKLKSDALSDTDLKGFMDSVSAIMGTDVFNDRIKDYEIIRVFDSKENRIVIPLSIEVREMNSNDFKTIVGRSPADQYTPKNGAMWEIKNDSGAMKFLGCAAAYVSQFKQANETGGTAESVPDVNALMNLKYIDYEIEDILVVDWNTTFSNRFAKLRAISNDGDSPQYMGGSDVHLQVTIQTQSEDAVRKLVNIPKEITRLTRTYHHVMPCVPLRINSEFSKFIGVNEVTCENAIVQTNEDYPGLYTVRLEFISMDRTVREREAAVRRAANNDGYNYYGKSGFIDWYDADQSGSFIDSMKSLYNSIKDTADFSTQVTAASLGVGALVGLAAPLIIGGGTVMGAGLLAGAGISALIQGIRYAYSELDTKDTKSAAGGLVDEVGSGTPDERDTYGDGTEISKKYMQFFDLKKALGENDLYPDLELPTIKEMEAVGYSFLRYKFQDERVYVDPDFYFLYPVALQSHVYRELAIHGMENNIADTKLIDSTGACATLSANSLTGYKITEKNDAFKRQQEVSKARKIAVQRMIEQHRHNSEENTKKEEADPTVTLVPFLNTNMERDSWAICSKINCMFLERRFKKEIESYLTTERANNVGNVNEARGTSNAENVQAAEQTAVQNSDTAVTQVVTDSGETVQEVYTEGKAIYDRFNLVQEVMLDTYKYLADTSVDAMMAAQNLTISTTFPYAMKGDEAFSYLSDYTRQFLQDATIQAFLKALKIEQDDDFVALTGYMVRAAACAATGNKEYSAKSKSTDWKPRNVYIGATAGLPGDNQIHSICLKTDESNVAEKVESVVRCGVQFGILGLQMYSAQTIYDMLNDSTESFTAENVVYIPKDYPEARLTPNINTSLFLLDPYYRKDHVSIVDIENYKRNCINDVRYCTFAYMRLVIYWLCRLVLRHALPTMTTDILRDLSKLQFDITDTQKQYTGTGEMLTKTSSGDLMSVQKYVDFYSKGVGQVDAGKMWTAIILASSSGDKTILKLIDNREYGSLNSIIQSCATVNANIDPKDNPGLITIRKIVLALVGQQVIDSMSALGVSQSLPANAYARDELQRLYLKASQDPKQFIPHSFHDMVVNDARGRMLRAFPTFYMCFIDEGRQIGFWKLHDNFYNTSSIQEITISKSRKIPADTCEIIMSNFYNSYTTEQEDYIKTQVVTLDQAWNSIFSPSEYFKDQEVYRRNKPMEIKLRLRQGARIHVRLGYGNNAAMIPPLFNGVITEVDSKEAVHIVAQGDGWELVNPIQIDKQAHNLSHSEDWLDSFDNADTPLQHATAIFNTMGGVVSEIAREQLHLNLGPRNPFGIVHFGDPDFKTFVKCGEACQNLYEAMSKPIFGGNIDVKNEQYDNWVSNDVPQITFDLFQKTPWDVLNICKSISPDFKLAVIPWNFRSTVFMGMPHYYYCYDYFKDVDGTIKEKRKPFEQWHIYTGENDIIGNGVKATARDMYNVAMGMYTVCESLNIESQETVGPLFADWDIYPESQRTMIVDTSLLGKGPAFFGTISNSIAQRLESWFNLFDDTGAVTNHKKVAWRSTASKLRESVQDMYAGDLVLFGDPSIKPQDRFYMSDQYTGIMGQALAKEVVYHLSGETGFITTVSPDCVAVVNDSNELIKTMAMERIGGIGSVFSGIIGPIADNFKYYGGMASAGLTGALSAGMISNAASKVGAVAKPIAQNALNWLKGIIPSISNTKLAGLGSSAMVSLLKGMPYIRAAAAMGSALVLPYINAFLEQELKNYKVIQIFPLKKFGYVYTAGFEGARGTVYGSPTWGDRGSLGDIFDYIEDKCPMLGTVADFLFNEEVRNLAKKYQRDNGIINADGSSADMQVKYGAFAAHLAGDDFTYQSTNYRSQQLTPRATVDNPATFKATINHYAMKDIDHYQSDPKLKNNKLISQDSRLKPYLDEQFFLIVHDDPGLETGDYSSGDYAQEETLVIDGKKYRTKFIHCSDDNGNPVIDIPLLNQDAINILYEIVRRAKGYMPSANTTDPNENWEITKNSYLVLKSALRIGDQTSAGSTGFTFIIAATDDRSQRALKAALTSLNAEIKSDEAKALGLQQTVFSYQERANREVAVFVNPPKQQEERNKNTGQQEEEAVSEDEGVEK